MVYAFEPDPDAREQLTTNLKINRAENVSVFDYALAEIDGVHPFRIIHGGTSKLVSGGKGLTSRKDVNVSCIRLDSFVSRQRIKPDVIKIDAEGYEYEVFRGGECTLRDPSTIIFLELHRKELLERGLLAKFTEKVMALSKRVYPVGSRSECTQQELGHGGHFLIRS
jgi:FkbM family methyltransferase